MVPTIHGTDFSQLASQLLNILFSEATLYKDIRMYLWVDTSLFVVIVIVFVFPLIF